MCLFVSTVGIVCSITPLVVCVIASFLLNEKMRRQDMITLAGVFIAVVMVIIYANPE